MINAIISAKVIDNQIPSTPNHKGNKIAANSLKPKVLNTEIIAEIIPLFNAVKKDEIKILIPITMKLTEIILNACAVIFNKSWLYPTNILANGIDKQNAKTAMTMPTNKFKVKLFFNKLFNSS